METPKKKIPINEIFGPTIQGEGPLAGAITHFVRTNGCDYRCSWCDTPDAIYPHLIKLHNAPMTADEIVKKLLELPPASTITYSGGNPCIHDALEEVIRSPRLFDFFHVVETQGTIIPDWVQYLDKIIVSPKPPSAGIEFDPRKLRDFMAHCVERGPVRETYLKVVVFSDEDLDFAEEIVEWYGAQHTIYLQVGCLGKPDLFMLNEAYIELADKVLKRPSLFGVRVLPQLHKYLWGHKRGV